jgi:phenylpropionate dioxygenase-like ring-hydroxylating dioxygenase large terminal subunit
VNETPVGADLRTLPYRWYTDPRIAEIERETIFRPTWQYAGHLAELGGPGSFFPAHAGGLPVVVTLDGDGALRAFVNVCRHRGAIVASAPARRGTLQCPYHVWTYGLDGALRAAPRGDLEPCFEREALGLAPVAVDTWGPFVFVCADPGAEPLPAALGDLPRSSPSTASAWTACASTAATRTSCVRTGRSRSRTTSSATTARSTIPASSTRSTTARCGSSRPARG